MSDSKHLIHKHVHTRTAEVQCENDRQRGQLAQLQLVLTNLDKERDDLQEEVDQKADKISSLENMLNKQVHAM